MGPAPALPRAEELRVRMRDGVHLATDVYLPRPLDGRVPAVLVRLCYDKSAVRPARQAMVGHFTDRGYAVVIQDVRGKFRSEGERMPWLHESRDGYDTIDWLSRQSWCDGRVAMYGHSYLGFTQWAAAASAHPGLRAIVPRAASERVPGAWFAPQAASPEGADWLARWWSAAGTFEGAVLDWDACPYAALIPDDLPDARRLHEYFLGIDQDELHAAIYPGGCPAARLAIPALHIGAWFDVMSPYQLRDWTLVSERAPAARSQHLVMAATDHQCMPFGSDAATLAADPLSSVRHQLEIATRFFDRCVRGVDGVERGPRVRYEIAGGGWRTAEFWPPPEARELVLSLAAAGRAARDADGGELATKPGSRSSATWIHDPARPVPSLAAGDHEMLFAPLADESALHARGDVLTFTGHPLVAPLDIAGPIALDAVVASAAPSMQLVATLLDVDPRGRATFVTEGIRRIDTRCGETAATVSLAATAYRFAPGHRLRLALASSRYPRYLTEPGIEGELWSERRRAPVARTLIAGGQSGSRLRLSTLAAQP